jgi:hypothetical protein
MLSRDKIKELFEKLDVDLRNRSVALHPPGDKRKLPADIPKRDKFRQLRVVVDNARIGMLALEASLRLNRRPAIPVPISDTMKTFLRLGDEFEGYYTRELLVKAINLYATLYDLCSGNSITLDTRLATATMLSPGETILRKRIFGLVAAAILKKPETLAQLETEKIEGIEEVEDIAGDEIATPNMLPHITAILDREQHEFEAIAALYERYKHTKQQVATIDTHEEKDVFQKEKNALLEQIEELEVEVEDAKASNRFLTPSEPYSLVQ